MRKAFPMVVLAAALVVLGSSYVRAEDGLSSMDIDPGECQFSFEFGGGSVPFDFEPANAHVAVNQRWVIAECHVKLSKSEIESIGGPFKQAQHYWDFECLVEDNEDTENTAEDIPAIVTHAVLSPSGVLNVFCLAEFAPPPE